VSRRPDAALVADDIVELDAAMALVQPDLMAEVMA
jgi:hypothetical protein